MIAATGAVIPVEGVAFVNGATTNYSTVQFRDFSTGTARYWTGSAWTGTPTTLPLTSGQYVLTVPTAWLGLNVQVTCALTGYPDLTDEISVAAINLLPNLDATVSSRASTQPAIVINPVPQGDVS